MWLEFQESVEKNNLNSKYRKVGDVSRVRRLKDPLRQQYYAQYRQKRFADRFGKQNDNKD
jgi:hypothetical protein